MLFNDVLPAVREYLLPKDRHHPEPPIPPSRVSIVAIKIRYLIEELIPVEIKESSVTRPHSRVITERVLKLVWEAGGDDKGCIIFALLACRKYFRRKSSRELADADLHDLRVTTCDRMAKLIIDSVDDDHYLFTDILLKRYSIMQHGKHTDPTSAVEFAVDLHATEVISANNYQRCITALWRGYYNVQYFDDDRLTFGEYKYLGSQNFSDHFDTQRIKVPRYQNILTLFFTLLFLVLYTIAVNTPNPSGEFDFVEGCLFAFVFGFFFDEVTKIYKVGLIMMGFWNAYNIFLYSTFILCFILRIINIVDLHKHPGNADDGRSDRQLSYEFLAFLAPFLYCRQLLYLDFYRFFGTMLIVLKEMLKESAVFFLLLLVIVAGFLQSFFGLDSADGTITVMNKVLNTMTQALLQSPNFDLYEDISPPFGLLLFYLFNFIVSVLLLNILVALFNQAYSVVTDNAVEEFLALFSHKTLNYIRAPDENTFCPPLNLIEIFLLIPLEPFLPKATYQKINQVVMKIVYSPVLTIIAFYESKIQARKVSANRLIGLDPGEESLGWDVENEFDAEENGWAERVHATIPRIDEDEMVLLRRLEKQLNRVEDATGVQTQTKVMTGGSRGGDEGAGTGGEEVATEAEEEGGTLGPTEWEQGRDKRAND